MRSTPAIDARAGLDKLATYPFQIATWVDDSGYPSRSRPGVRRPGHAHRDVRPAGRTCHPDGP
jgi:hypothetical protein